MGSAKEVDPAAAAELFIIRDHVHEPMHDRFLWATMQRRNKEAAAIPEWEELREIASTIKEHTLTHLDNISKSSKPTPRNGEPMFIGLWTRRSTTKLCTRSLKITGRRN